MVRLGVALQCKPIECAVRTVDVPRQLVFLLNFSKSRLKLDNFCLEIEDPLHIQRCKPSNYGYLGVCAHESCQFRVSFHVVLRQSRGCWFSVRKALGG